MYMMIAMTVFSTYPADQRMSYVKKFYDAVSLFYISLPTPVMAGVRTPLRQYASCVLIDIDDSLDSIFASDMAIGRYVAKRAGIGLNCGRIRGIGSSIRRGEVVHTGVIPFLKKFEATVRCCTQNGVRGGSSTAHFPVWHQEIEDIIVLKNNKGTEDNRVRKLDYSIQLSKLFYQRYLDNSFITLFSPHDVPGLYDAFGTDNFDELYRKYEKDSSIPSKKVSARDLFHLILKERAETGRIYLMNIDHVNSHSSFDDHICMSNLCQEITLPTTPIENIEGEGDIALCVLSAINIAKIEQPDDFKEYCSLAVRALDQLIDYQEYPVPAARQSALDRRSLGIGFIGLAHFFAKHSVGYGSDKALQLLHRYTEAFQYYLIDASAELAREKGACRSYSATKYSRGIFPVDTYKEAVDELGEFRLQYDWDLLRRKVSQTGLRNSALSAQMPSESSSVVSNETNGIEPPRGYMSVKKSKKGTLKQIVPEIDSLKDSYSLLWDMKDNEGYIKTVAVMQKFFDQGISGNWSYNPLNYDEKQVPVSKIAMDMLYSYKLGWKTVYYQNTYDYKNDFEAVEEEQQCSVCVI
jgi:ribonucleoside-diphosphate reductase alpha chain